MWVGSFEIVIVHQLEVTSKMYTLFEGQAFRYCVLHMFRIPKKRAFGQLTKLESYYYTKIKYHSLYMRVTVVLCNNNHPCTFVSPRFCHKFTGQ